MIDFLIVLVCGSGWREGSSCQTYPRPRPQQNPHKQRAKLHCAQQHGAWVPTAWKASSVCIHGGFSGRPATLNPGVHRTMLFVSEHGNLVSLLSMLSYSPSYCPLPGLQNTTHQPCSPICWEARLWSFCCPPKQQSDEQRKQKPRSGSIPVYMCAKDFLTFFSNFIAIPA